MLPTVILKLIQPRSFFCLRWRAALSTLLFTLFAIVPAFAAQQFKIGVLAFRPKPQTLAQWQPLAASLKQAMPEYDFVVEALNYPELERAVIDHRVDFVLTNPGHYVLLSKRGNLSAPLATLIVDESGYSTSQFGGVIFTRADELNVRSLGDLKGKTVATAAIESLGGYQMQAYEFIRAKVDLRTDVQIVATGMPHDNVIQAVLSGRADAGLVRTGVLEDLVREGKLDITKVFILNEQKNKPFPVKLSTQLYPEWAFVARHDVDEKISRRVTAALYTLDKQPSALEAMRIHGFGIPADYSPVVDMLTELRLPPFDQMPKFTAADVWGRYRVELFLIMLLLVVVVTMGGRLFLLHRELKNREAIFRGLFDQSIFLAGILDSDGVLLEANKTALNVIAAKEVEVIGKYFPDTPWWAIEAHRTQLVKTLEIAKSGTPSSFEAVHPDAHDGEVTVMFTAMPIKLPNDLRIAVIGVDVTERKRLELSLENDRRRMADVIWGTGVGTWEWNVQTGETRFNERWAELIGYTLKELEPISIETWVKFAHPDDLEGSNAALEKHFKGETDFYHFESRMRHKEGHWIWVLDRGRVNSWTEDGKPLWMAGTHFEITERKQAEAELQRSNAELEQFSYSISHDMRQPLRMISSYLTLLQMSLANNLDAEKQGYFKFAIDGAKRMDSMMLGLLNYSRVGRKGEPAAWVESRKLLSEALLFLQPAITEAQVQVLTEGEWPQVFVSADEVIRLLQNLIGNAIKFQVEGRTAEVKVRSEIFNAHWRVTITDNGVGILPDQIGRLFQVFQRLQSQAKYEGTGIGLALCRKIVEHHGGTIWVESAGEDQGSSFIFELPML